MIGHPFTLMVLAPLWTPRGKRVVVGLRCGRPRLLVKERYGFHRPVDFATGLRTEHENHVDDHIVGDDRRLLIDNYSESRRTFFAAGPFSP